MSGFFVTRATISKPVSIEGRGLHSGANINLRLVPASAKSGIRFVRTDLNVEIQGLHTEISNTKLATRLGTGQNQISTVEHLLAACSAWGIDDLSVEVDGPEIPLMDGSSSAFVFLLERAGRKEFPGIPREYLRIKKEIMIQMGKSYVELSPSNKNQLIINGSFDYDHPKLRHQKLTYTHTQKNFLNELCSARTFCFLRDIEVMREQGLIKGGSLQSAVVLDDNSVLNPEGLRYPNEMVRHKILDCIGDLYLAGYPILGSLDVHCGGHEVHRLVLNAIFEDKEAFEIVDFADSLDQLPELAYA